MANGGGNLTIQQLHANVVQQASLGGAVVLSNANMPSATLWQSVERVFGVPSIDITPPATGTVLVGAISGDQFPITGNLALLGFGPRVETVTVKVAAGVPDFSFTMGRLGATNWTFGDWFFEFDTAPFNRLVQSDVFFTWDSSIAMTATTSPLSYSAKVALIGPFSFMDPFAATTIVPWTAGPVIYMELNQWKPAFDFHAPLTGNTSFTIGGFLDVGLPYLQAKASYTEDPDDPGSLITSTAVNFAMQLQETGTTLKPFTFTVPVMADNSVLYLLGRYGDPGDVLSLGDVCQWLLDLPAPPALPAPLDGFFNNVGLESFSANFGAQFTSDNFAQLLSLQVDVDSRGNGSGEPVWNLYNNEITVRRIYMSASVLFVTASYAPQSYLFGAELQIFQLLFTLEMGIQGTESISLRGELTTVDGLPLRFNDLLRKLNSGLSDVNLEDFFELTFSVIAAELEYQSSTSAYLLSVYTEADVSLRLFGKELLALHDLHLLFTGSGNMNNGSFAYGGVFASGTIAILGFTLPASLSLSSESKVFDVGPFSFTLGDILKFLVQVIHPSWDFELPAPWNVLDSIGFENLHLTFDLVEDSISLSTGVIADFGFLSLDHLSLTYYRKTPKAKKEGVVLSLQGTFLGLPITTDDPDDEGLAWDVVNDKPPEVPGDGLQVFKLEYLGLGQHISFRDPGELDTVGQVITALETNLRPTGNDTDPLSGASGLVFNQNSGWLIGAKFTVIETVTISAIFNDPYLYGIRIALEGPRAKSFAGLEFEILYKKVTDTIGLYHIELKLPDAMRQLEFGEVSITLPVVVVDIYTNGNFRVDFGFPYHNDFARSFSLQVFPFVGFGGFYFALLDGATSRTVPQVTNGEFGPVIEFGFGLSVGVGKTIHKGVLSGGLTVTVEGILEGTLAWFNPTDVEQPKDLDYRLLGTIAIVGELFGEIDFAVIKASVEVKAWARATLLIEAYREIHISIDVGVEASVKVKILFVTIHLSFEMVLHEEFTIGHSSPTPWQLAPGQSQGEFIAKAGTRLRKRLRAQRPRRNLRPRTRRPSIETMLREPLPDWKAADQRIAASLGTPPAPLTLTFFPSFSQSNAASIVGDDGQQAPYKVESIPILVLENSIPIAAKTREEILAVQDLDPSTPFNAVTAAMLNRVIAARVAARGGNQSYVTAYDLAVIYTQLLAGLADDAFSYTSLAEFFTSTLPFEIAFGSSGTPAASGTIFPLPPALTITSSDGFVDVDYATDPRLMVDSGYEAAIEEYFRSFQVRSQTSVAAAADPANLPRSLRRARRETTVGTTETMTSYVFRDYFLLLTRGAVQACIDFLQNYLYTTAGGLSLEQLAASLAATVEQPQLTDPTAFSIALANQSAPGILDTAARPSLAGVLYQTRSTDTVAAIAALFGITAFALIGATGEGDGFMNAAEPGMLIPNVLVSLGNLAYVVEGPDESMQSVAMRFAITIEALVTANPGIENAPLTAGQHIAIPAAKYAVRIDDTFQKIVDVNVPWGLTLEQLSTACANDAGILKPLSVWNIPTFAVTIGADDTLQSIAARYNLELADLVADGFGAAAGLLLDGKTIVVPNRPDILITTLVDAIVTGPAVNDVAGQVSRFLLHGFRLPPGTTSPPDFSNLQPLYNLTGQEYDAPAGGPYSLAIAINSGTTWLTLAGGADYTYSEGDFATIAALRTSFTPTFQPPSPIPLMAYAPNRYSLDHSIHWQAPEGTSVVDTGGGSANAVGEPLLWMFPDALLDRLANGPAAASGISDLRYELTVGVQSDPNAPMQTTPVDVFAWGTAVDLRIQLVRQPENTIVNVDNDYQMYGADQDGRATLQRLWTYMNSTAGAGDPAAIYLLFAANPADPNGSGLLSASVDASATLLLQTNLSTVSTSGNLFLIAGGSADGDDPYQAPITDPKNFVRLLWECSTAGTGGYYLNYTQSAGAIGLPSNIFDESGMADLTMLVIFESQQHAAGAPQPRIGVFNDVAVLAQSLDSSISTLYVEALTFSVPAAATLQSVASSMGFAAPLDFATVNQDIKMLLLTGATISAAGSNHTVALGDTLRSVAAILTGGDLSTLVTAIAATTGILTPGALVQYAPNQMALQSTAPVGSVGFLLVRDNPDPNDLSLDDLTPQQQLDVLFNLVGYDVQSGTYFAPPAGTSGEGLPAGPTQPASSAPDPQHWIYRNTVQASVLAKPQFNYAPSLAGLPPVAGNAYAGLAAGSSISLALQFQDIYGNRTAFTSSSQPVVDLPYGYHDNVFAVSAWPAIALSYDVTPGTAPQVSLGIDVAFNLASYVSGEGRLLAQSGSSVATDLEKLRQVYYQFVQPDVNLTLTTSLAQPAPASPRTAYFPWKASLFDALDGLYLFLAGIASMTPVMLQPAAGDELTTLGAPYLVDAGQLLENNSALIADTLFDFSTSTTLTYPVYSIVRAGDSMQVIVDRAGGSVTVTQLAANNTSQPLPPGRVVHAPQRTLPPSGQSLGNQSLRQAGAAYAASPAGLAVANASTANILRPGTRVSLSGLAITIGASDTFSSLATRFMQYTVTDAANTSLQQVADVYGMQVSALAIANESVAGIWAGTFTYMGHQETATAADDLFDIATRFSAAGFPLTVTTLAAANKDVTTLFAANAVLTTGLYQVAVTDVAYANLDVPSIFVSDASIVTDDLVFAAGDTLTSVAAKYGFTVGELATLNAVLPDFFVAGTPLFINTSTFAPPSGMNIAGVAGALSVSYHDLGVYNGAHPLLAQERPNVQIPGRLVMPPAAPLVPYRVAKAADSSLSETLSTIATKLGGGATALSVAEGNWTLPYAVTPGIEVSFSGQQVLVLETDTFSTIQQKFVARGVSPTNQQLVDALDAPGDLRLGATLLAANPTPGSSTKPAELAARLGVDAIQFLAVNRSTAGFLGSGVSVTVRVAKTGASVTVTTRANETINTLLTLVKGQAPAAAIDDLLAALVPVACLSSTTRMLVPPAGYALAGAVTPELPSFVFAVEVALACVRVNFEITQHVLDALAAAGVSPSDISALQPMLSVLYTSGDAFRGALRTNLGASFATFPLDLALRLSELPTAFIDPAMAGVATVLGASSLLPPQLVDGTDGALTSFATAFESAFDGALKLGTGGESKTSRAAATRKLWAVRLGPGGYQFELGQTPSYFALEPLSNALESRTGVRMQRYEPGTGLVAADPVDLDAIELDTWARQFTAAVDLFLSGPYAIPAAQRRAADVETVIGCKKLLAGYIAGDVANLLESPVSAGDLADAQTAFADRLKIRLSDAFTIEAAMQYPVTVTGSDSSDPSTAPRLSGKPVNTAYVTGTTGTIASIAATFSVSQEFLLDEIGAMTGILNDGVNGAPPAVVQYTPPGGGASRTVTLTPGMTLDALAAAFGLQDVYGLIGTLTVTSGGSLFAPATAINITGISVAVGSTGQPGVTIPPNSFDDLAYYFNLFLPSLARSIQDVAAIFAASVTSLSYGGRETPVTAADTLRTVATRLVTDAPTLAEFYRTTANLLRPGTVVSSLSVLPQYGLTTAKIPLSTTGSYLTFFVSVESPAQRRKLFMDLDYTVNELEFDIQDVSGIDDYQASSWLTFVLPLDSNELGQTEVPVLMRAYPTPPVLQTQEGVPTVAGRNPPLQTLKSWEYEYSFEYQAADQDEIYTTVRLTDVTGGGNRLFDAAVDPPLTLFEALAQFAANQTAVQNDLDLLPSMKPDSESDTTESAIAAFTTLVQQVTDAWAPNAGELLVAAGPAIETHEYLVTFRHGTETVPELKTMIFGGVDPNETLWPDHAWILRDGEWVPLTRQEIAPGAREVVFDFPPGIVSTISMWYRIGFNGLDVIRYQSGASAVRIERNRHLISESPTALPFTYSTPEVAFANPFTPLLERDEEYVISGGGVSLASALGTFFEDLFDAQSPVWSASSTRDVSVTCGYRFPLTAGAGTTAPDLVATTPVAHHTRYPFVVQTDYHTTAGTFVSYLASAVATWQADNIPSGTGGTWVFNVVVYETKETSDGRPVLDLRNVTYGFSG